jgi:TonB family protein
MTLMPVVPLLLMLASTPGAFQAPFDSLPLAHPSTSLGVTLSLSKGQDRPRDTPPPAVETVRREQELRSAIAAGLATRESFVELALLLIRQNRFDEAIVALRGAAAAPAPRFAEPFEASMARLQPLRVGGNIRPPTKITDVKPVYPPIAQSARIQGVVVVEALVDDQGNVVNARVVRSIPLLDAAALEAVSKWKYAPADVDGRLVAVVMTVTTNFVMQ